MSLPDIFSPDELRRLAAEHGTPSFVYSAHHLQRRAHELTSLKLPFGLTVRYAMKANPLPEILTIFHEAGLHFDASSSYETMQLLEMGVPGNRISLSSQQPPHNLSELLDAGVQFVATSLHQLELFVAAAKPGSTVGLRVNPGLGAGHNNRNMTGGANSSFGLWNSYVPDAQELAGQHNIVIDRLHVHIGSGADPKMWDKAIITALEIAETMPDVTSLDIGGGFKIHRYGDEHEADMQLIGQVFADELQKFANRTGRQLRLEVEPGTWLVGHAGILLAEVVDIVDTGADGHVFLRLNTGMNDFIRPSMYGAQHRIAVLNDSTQTGEYVVVGHNCETGDILTPAPGDPEGIEARELAAASIGDVVAIYDTGAYCHTFAATGYNAYPPAKKVIV